MSTPETKTAIHTSVRVNAPIDVAFTASTSGIHEWWPPEHHILDRERVRLEFDAQVGGSIIETSDDGSQCRWARVLDVDPPHLQVFSGDLSPEWTVESNLQRTSEVAVHFTSDGADRTLVELEQRHLDRHGAGWIELRDSIGSPNGWQLHLDRFANSVEE